jgi:hypothetical protein
VSERPLFARRGRLESTLPRRLESSAVRAPIPSGVTGFPPRRISLVATDRMAHANRPIDGHLASAG